MLALRDQWARDSTGRVVIIGGGVLGTMHAVDVDEDAYDHLRSRAEALLGAPLPRTRRRWAGVYSEVVQPSAASSSPLYHRSTVAPGVILETGPGGRGMTCSPAIAEETRPPRNAVRRTR
jgi:glycine/D-amino acid oxidase-like deaminating enzyme